MSRQQNFLEADNNFREQNLRFVRNNLEDNINQFFGVSGGGVGSGGGGGGGGVGVLGGNGRPCGAVPPRNFKIVQPTPEFEQRREFFLQLGLSRSEAVSLSNRSFCSEQFNINYFRDKRHQLRKSRLKQTEADAKIVKEISVTIAELERQASNFGGGGGGFGFNDRRDGGNFGGGFNGGNQGVFNGPRGSEGRGSGNPENLNSIGGPVSGIFMSSGPGNFEGRSGGGNSAGIGFPENFDVRGRGFQENLNSRSGDGLGLLDARGSNSNRNLGDRPFDAPGIIDDRRGNAGNFDGRSAAPGIWDDKRGGGQQNFDRSFIGKIDSGPGNFDNRGNDGPRNFDNRGNDGPRNFDNRGNDGPRNFDNRGNDGPRNFDNRGDGPRNFGNRDNCGPDSFGNMGDVGLGNFGNRGNCGPESFGNMGGGGPGNFGNRGDCGPENFGNRADGNRGNFDQKWSGDAKNINTRGDGAPGNFVGGPRGFDSSDGGGSHVFDNRSGGGSRGFDAREGTGPNNFDNRRYNGNSTIGDQSGRFNEVGVRRSDGREGFETGGSGFNKQFEESLKRRAPTPPRNINWNDRKRTFPGDVNDGPPSSVFINERNMNDFPRQSNFDDFNRRRSPQPNMNQRDFGQFGGGNNNQGQGIGFNVPFAPNNNRAANILNSKEQNFDRDHGRVGNIGKQNMPVSSGGLIVANNNRNQNNNNANLHPTSVGNASIGRGGFGGNNANRPNIKGDLRSGNNLNSTATSGRNVVDRSRNKINENPPNKSGAQSNNKVQSNRDVVANNNNRNKAALNTRKGDSDGTNLNRNIQNQPNNSNMNSQRRNISQNSNIPNSSQSIGNIGRGSSNPSNNIPSLMSNSNIAGFGNRGANGNFNNMNVQFPGNNFGGGAGFQEGHNNFNNFESMNPGDIDIVGLLTTLASTTNLIDDSANIKNVVPAPRVRRRRRSRRSSRSKVNSSSSMTLGNLVYKKEIEWPFKVQKRSSKKIEPLPQPLQESYAVHFFSKRLPRKSGIEPEESTVNCVSIWLDDKSDIDSDIEDAADEEPTYKVSLPIHIKTIKKDWRRFDKSQDKGEIWLKWWQEYKQYETKIRNKLDEFQGQPIKGAISYTPPKNCANPKWQIQNKCNQILRFLSGQGGDSYLIAKYFYLLKDQQFWNMLNEEQMSSILLGIQHFKNSSWLDFQRGLILTWIYFDEMINFEKETEGVLTAAHKQICKRAKMHFQNGIFHWMVKEAHFDLKRICGKQWPKFGFCIKSFKVNTNEKYFVNVCQTDEIPAPEDLTEEQLTEILSSETPSNYRIPMSISEPRITKDKSDNVVEVCDIAVNPKFFVKCKKSVLFKDFFLALIAEALSEKYNVQISMEKTIILATRKFIGSLVSHRVRNNDVQKVLQSFQTPTEDDKAKLEHLSLSPTRGVQRSLVQEIDAKEISTLQKFNEKLRTEKSAKNKKEPLYKLRAKLKDEKVDEIQAEFYLPKCITSQEITLDIGEDRILMESMKHGYTFDKFVNYRLNQQRARAIYDKTNKMLQLRIPVLAAE